MMNTYRNKLILILVLFVLLLFGGCSADEEETVEESTLDFTDVYGILHTLTIDLGAPLTEYDSSFFVLDDQNMSYIGDAAYRLGLDISYYQGEIDWESVSAAGFEFVFIRIGYRGYGSAGTLMEDERFAEYLSGARTAGLDVGVYFFSQAVSEEEALEEAEFVLALLDGTELELPVVYDPEYILDETGEKIEGTRTCELSGEQITANTLAFCARIETSGYEAAFYASMLSEAEVFDMAALSAYSVWYADYSSTPQTPYAFVFWQYSEAGTVDGIEGPVDLNIQMLEGE